MALRGTMRPAVSISGSVKMASGGDGNVSFVTDETLSFVGGVLSVNVTDQVEEGNTLPVSSAAVYAAIDPAVEASLKEAKESGEFDGAPGKSAYQYAQEGGFTGTEEEFADKVAKEHPKKISELENDSKFITASGAPVQSVNGKTGAVTLNADDVGARADDWMPTAAEVGARPENWMPTATEVGARPDNWMPTAAEVGALPNTYTPPNQTAEQVGADPSGTAAGKVAAHNTNTGAHSDIRLLISTLTTRLDALANSDDTTLDQMAEVVAYIKDNRELIEQITTGKVSVTDIVNNLTTNVANKPLSAAQGVAIKALIDGLSTGKLDASKLTEAINTALAQAKASGEFDGDPGDDGVSVSSVKQTTTSSADGGSNVITVTLSDGTTYTFTVKNGSKGNKGDPGYTPQKYVDYFTLAEQEAFVQQVITALGTPVFGTVDADNNIILTGELADGVYTIKYEDGEGNVAEIGGLEVGGISYTNILGVYEIFLNKRWSSSGKTWSDCNGMLGIKVPVADINGKTVRWRGFPKAIKASSQSARWYTVNSSNATVGATFVTTAGAGYTDDLWGNSVNIAEEGNDIFSITMDSANFKQYSNSSAVYVMMNMPVSESSAITDTDVENLVMVIDEEIAE